MNFIFGSAGFAKEVDWLIDDINKSKGKVIYNIDYFVADDENPNVGTCINGKQIISEKQFFNQFNAIEKNVFISVGNPRLKEKIYIKLNINAVCNFPNLIHPNVSFDSREGKIVMGHGNIICSKTVLTTDITLGNFVHINLDCTIGHDVTIKDFSTLSPGVHISGNVTINEKVYIGTGTVVLEKINICSNVTIGAGAVVTKDITEPGTYVGVPAVRIK